MRYRMNIQHLENRLGELRNLLLRRGLQIDVMGDYPSISHLFADMGGKRSHPVSEVTNSDLLQSRGLWFGMRDNSQYFTCISARLDCLESQPFSTFWGLHCARKYPDRNRVIADVNRELNASLSGNLIYFGGGEVADGYKGDIRRLSVSNEFVRCYALI